jgi:hypothetical protein
LSGIQTHDPSNQPAKTRTSDHTAAVTGNNPQSHYLNFKPEGQIITFQTLVQIHLRLFSLFYLIIYFTLCFKENIGTVPDNFT